MSQRTRTRDMIYDFIPPTPCTHNEWAIQYGRLQIVDACNILPKMGMRDTLYYCKDTNQLYVWTNDHYVPLNAAINVEGIHLDGGGAYDS